MSTTCIALASARNSGKSVYLGVLVAQLLWLAERSGTVLKPWTKDTDDLYRDRYQRPLFIERGLLQATCPHERGDVTYHETAPLLYQMTLPGRSPHVIVLRDVAGENLQSPDIDP